MQQEEGFQAVRFIKRVGVRAKSSMQHCSRFLILKHFQFYLKL